MHIHQSPARSFLRLSYSTAETDLAVCCVSVTRGKTEYGKNRRRFSLEIFIPFQRTPAQPQRIRKRRLSVVPDTPPWSAESTAMQLFPSQTSGCLYTVPIPLHQRHERLFSAQALRTRSSLQIHTPTDSDTVEWMLLHVSLSP